MEQVIKDKMLAETYWSMDEFTDRASKSALKSTKDLVSDRPDFTFPPGQEHEASFSKALQLGRDGWTEELPETLRIAESAVETADKEHMMESFNQPVWDVTGAQVDVGAYLAGTPECMIDYPLTVTSKQGRVITLAVGTAISAAISADTYLRRGRGIVALALALAQLGHAVEIWAYDASDNNAGTHGYCHSRTLVKSAHDEIDPSRLMFALAHPAMQRALSWAVRDKFPQPWKEGLSFKASRGMPRNTVSKAERDLYPEGTIILPGIRREDDIPKPEEFLREKLGELGLLAE